MEKWQTLTTNKGCVMPGGTRKVCRDQLPGCAYNFPVEAHENMKISTFSNERGCEGHCPT